MRVSSLQFLCLLSAVATSGSTGLAQTEAEEEFQYPFELIPHRPNYILPIAWSSDTGNINQAAIDPAFQLDHIEIHFQLSLKFPIRQEFIFQDSPLWLGYTVRSFWQAYNTDVSRPFRETNHEPELFWEIPSTIRFWGFDNTSNSLIINHQSNGQSGELSRSWNRVMVASRWEYGNLRFVVTPWAKMPHEITIDAGLVEDNPDITEYLGYFELLSLYQWGEQQISMNLRNNLSHRNRGSVELRWAFPLQQSFKGLITYFNGYGESLIDYNHSQERLSIGIQMSDWY